MPRSLCSKQIEKTRAQYIMDSAPSCKCHSIQKSIIYSALRTLAIRTKHGLKLFIIMLEVVLVHP